MTTQEFSTEFDVLYDNISSGQAPGLTEYEKSIFLTKAQSEIIKNYFNPKGNKYQEGFDDSPKRQMDFSMLMKTTSCTAVTASVNLHGASNVGYYSIPSDILLYINEFVDVTRKGSLVRLVILPLSYDEYNKLMSKPFRRPLKNQAWRLITSGEGVSYTYTDYGNLAAALDASVSKSFTEIYNLINGKTISTKTDSNVERITVDGQYLKADGTLSSTLPTDGITATDTMKGYITTTVSATTSVVQIVPGPNDTIGSYIIRYVRRPRPIILENLGSEGLTIDGVSTETTCELDPILHQEILQRAVELAKAAYTGDVTSAVELGNRSE